VFWNSTSAPWLIRLCAASVSLAVSNQVLTHTTLVLTFGLTLCAPSVKLLMLRMTSGMGIEPTTPSVLDLVMPPAMTPAM
jgi:predicted nucleic acid-binding protein